MKKAPIQPQWTKKISRLSCNGNRYPNYHNDQIAGSQIIMKVHVGPNFPCGRKKVPMKPRKKYAITSNRIILFGGFKVTLPLQI